jgi:hypothetical protein
MCWNGQGTTYGSILITITFYHCGKNSILFQLMSKVLEILFLPS